MEYLDKMDKENKLNVAEKQTNVRTENVWVPGNYQRIATMLPSISAHLTRLTNIQQSEPVLDIAYGNGNTAITARRKGAHVTGIDITLELLSLTAGEEKIAHVSGIEWEEGDAQIYHMGMNLLR